jgi:large subunit ribosomal protein L14
MIQKGSYLNVVDNSGIKTVQCIHIFGGYKKRYSKLGEIILISIKNVRNIKAANQKKVKKGDICKALIVKTRKKINFFNSEKITFFENAVILYNLKNKPIGTRIFGGLSKYFRYTKYLKILSISAGII